MVVSGKRVIVCDSSGRKPPVEQELHSRRIEVVMTGLSDLRLRAHPHAGKGPPASGLSEDFTIVNVAMQQTADSMDCGAVVIGWMTLLLRVYHLLGGTRILQLLLERSNNSKSSQARM